MAEQDSGHQYNPYGPIESAAPAAPVAPGSAAELHLVAGDQEAGVLDFMDARSRRAQAALAARTQRGLPSLSAMLETEAYPPDDAS